MKPTTVCYARKFSLGNYETESVQVEAQLAEGESILQAWTDLKALAEEWHQDKNKKPTQQPQTQPQPVKTPAQLANENTEKRKASQAGPEVCPSCGGKKRADYPVCYLCHMKEKEQQ